MSKPKCGDRIYVTTRGGGRVRFMVKEFDGGRWRTVAFGWHATKTARRRFRRYCDRKYGRIG